MSICPSKPITHLLGFAAVLAAIAGAVLLLARDTQTTSGVDGGPEIPEMRLVVVEPEGACVESVCQVGLLTKFTLGVEIVEAPPQGYIEAASFIFYGSDITFDPTASRARDEIVWPDCDTATAVRGQVDNTRPPPGVGPTNTDEAVNHGCLSGLLTQPISHYVGMFVEISFTCSEGPSLNEIDLLPVGAGDDETSIASSSGSKFKDGQQVTIDPKLSGLTVRCGEPPTATPTATITPGGATLTPLPTPTPSVTPTPTVTPSPVPLLFTPTATVISELPCGDVNGDFMVDSQDALWVLWFASNQIIHLPVPGDIDGDGVTGPVDALFILWITLNLYLCR